MILTQDELAMFVNMGIKADNYEAMLGVIIAAPQPIVNILGIERTISIVAWLASRIPQSKVDAAVFYNPSFKLGALDPADKP